MPTGPRILVPFVPGIVLATALLFLPALSTNTALAETNCFVADQSFDSQEQALLDQINAYRAQRGAPPLTMSESLNKAASWMAQDMATKNYFAHRDSLGRGPTDRMLQCDGAGAWAGENLASGTLLSDAGKTLNAWQRSSGHNQNMLDPRYQQAGIARYDSGGYWGWYWVAIFIP